MLATTWWQEFRKNWLTSPPGLLQASRKTAPPVNRNSATKTTLRRSKQTKFCWPFSSWQTKTILLLSMITLLEFPSCQSHSPQRCARLTGNPRYSRAVWRTFPNDPQNSQSADWRWQNQPFSLFHEGDALLIFKNINGLTWENLGDSSSFP